MFCLVNVFIQFNCFWHIWSIHIFQFQGPMQLWQKMRYCQTKLVTPKLNQAPYHVISQCFYVYVLLKGGHSVKNRIQQKMTIPQSAQYVSHLKRSHVQCPLDTVSFSSHNPNFSFQLMHLCTSEKAYGIRTTASTGLFLSVFISNEDVSVSWILYMCRMWQYLMIPNNRVLMYVDLSVCSRVNIPSTHTFRHIPNKHIK